jgi:siroheme synthase (precorrin-2 oxidase/ferrochelatase)
VIEKHFIIEEADPIVFYGANNANLRMLKALCPKLRIVARDNVVKVMCSEADMADFEDIFRQLEQHCVKYNQLSEEDILEIKLQDHARKILKEKIDDQKIRREYLETILNNDEIRNCLKENKLDEAKGLAENLINSNLS